MKLLRFILAALFLFSSNTMAAMIYQADEAYCDSYSKKTCSDGYSFDIKSDEIRGKKGSKSFQFVDETAIFKVEDGSAVLIGKITNGQMTYDVYTEFNDLSSDPFSGKPKKQLKKKSYTNNSGPVDTDSWDFTGNTNTANWTGYLLEEGALDDGYQPVDIDAAVFEFSLINAGFQLGEGANGKNINFGASAWFEFFRVADGTSLGNGKLNVDLAAVPLPGGMPLFLSATAGLIFIKRKEKSGQIVPVDKDITGKVTIARQL